MIKLLGDLYECLLDLMGPFIQNFGLFYKFWRGLRLSIILIHFVWRKNIYHSHYITIKAKPFNFGRISVVDLAPATESRQGWRNSQRMGAARCCLFISIAWKICGGAFLHVWTSDLFCKYCRWKNCHECLLHIATKNFSHWGSTFRKKQGHTISKTFKPIINKHCTAALLPHPFLIRRYFGNIGAFGCLLKFFEHEAILNGWIYDIVCPALPCHAYHIGWISRCF